MEQNTIGVLEVVQAGEGSGHNSSVRAAVQLFRPHLEVGISHFESVTTSEYFFRIPSMLIENVLTIVGGPTMC